MSNEIYVNSLIHFENSICSTDEFFMHVECRKLFPNERGPQNDTVLQISSAFNRELKIGITEEGGEVNDESPF